jgi:hypothetical protein
MTSLGTRGNAAKPERSAKQAPAVTAVIVPSFIDFGRETCCSLDAASDREWRP